MVLKALMAFPLPAELPKIFQFVLTRYFRVMTFGVTPPCISNGFNLASIEALGAGIAMSIGESA
jgi:hypothetical protein